MCMSARGVSASASPQLDAFLAAGETAPELERTDDEGEDWRAIRTAVEIVVAAVDQQDRASLDTAITGLSTAAQSLGPT